MDKEIKSRQDKEEKPKEKKQTKLSYKDQRDLDILPGIIEELEAQLDTLNACLQNPECYQEKGLTIISEELAAVEAEYEEKSERYLEVLEMQETLEG